MAALSAAATAAEQTGTKLSEPPSSPVLSSDEEPVSADSDALQDFVVDFLEREVGNDVKSLKNVGNLLKKLREENKLLEEQVRSSSSNSLVEEQLRSCSRNKLLEEQARSSSNSLHQRSSYANESVGSMVCLHCHIHYLRGTVDMRTTHMQTNTVLI